MIMNHHVLNYSAAQHGNSVERSWRSPGRHHHLLQLDACHKGHGEPKVRFAVS